MFKHINIFLALVAAFFIVRLDAAYGLKWKPGDDAAVASSYLVAENAFTLRMRQPDGKIRVFHRDFSQPSLLYGEPPWVGEDVGNGSDRRNCGGRSWVAAPPSSCLLLQLWSPSQIPSDSTPSPLDTHLN